MRLNEGDAALIEAVQYRVVNHFSSVDALTCSHARMSLRLNVSSGFRVRSICRRWLANMLIMCVLVDLVIPAWKR